MPRRCARNTVARLLTAFFVIPRSPPLVRPADAPFPVETDARRQVGRACPGNDASMIDNAPDQTFLNAFANLSADAGPALRWRMRTAAPLH